jgi:POT family proton-dependent oligopeptide transporter
MDRHVFGYNLLPSQIQAANPVLILLLVPIFSYGVYPAVGRLVEPTPLRKIATGMFIAAGAFAISAWIEHRITAGEQPWIVWQGVAYVVLTAAEVMISITCLEFSYTQAPRRMKSLVMGLWFLSVALGNVFTAVVAKGIDLPGSSYYWFYTGLMLATAVAFAIVARFYRSRTYMQQEAPPTLEPDPRDVPSP